MPNSQVSDRIFIGAFALSLGLHLVLLIGQLLHMSWVFTPAAHAPLEVVYQVEAAKEELHQLQEELARATRRTAASPAPSTVGNRTDIRIPDRPSLTAGRTLADLTMDRTAVVDLTNLVDAAHGDPVLLSYFSAIREQIQRAANARAWISGQRDEGLVFVTFSLSASGTVQGVTIVDGRSASSTLLQDAAVRIVKAAAPFPPFPPSLPDPQKTVVVPLEFLLGG